MIEMISSAWEKNIQENESMEKQKEKCILPEQIPFSTDRLFDHKRRRDKCRECMRRNIISREDQCSRKWIHWKWNKNVKSEIPQRLPKQKISSQFYEIKESKKHLLLSEKLMRKFWMEWIVRIDQIAVTSNWKKQNLQILHYRKILTQFLHFLLSLKQTALFASATNRFVSSILSKCR